MHPFRLVLAFVMASLMVSPAESQSLSLSAASLAQAHRRLLDNYTVIERHGGHDLAVDLVGRFSLDHDAIFGPTPPSYTADAWTERTINVVRLDSFLIDALIAGKESDFRGQSGLFECVLRVNADGSLQPYSLYVPPS
ncbi:MAG: hypothetical protein JO233_06730, partial [Candidatus Eremiobacteraeota bacterium]|nr:hypothetical protein [Candidatus Eremiobacteraeota bacterium]